MTPEISLGQSPEYFLTALRSLKAGPVSRRVSVAGWISKLSLESGKKSKLVGIAPLIVRRDPSISSERVSPSAGFSHPVLIDQLSSVCGVFCFHDSIAAASAEVLVSAPMVRV